MSGLTGWSYSSLTEFENCPRAYQMKRVTKEVVDTGSEATREGTRVHLALEERVRDGKPLPPDLQKHEDMANSFATFKGDVYTEIPLAVDKDLNYVPVEYKEGRPDWPKNAWCKGIIDVLAANRKGALVADYKTGKVREDSKQLMLMSALVFVAFQDIRVVNTSFLWLKYDKSTNDMYKREDETYIWSLFMPRVQRLEKAHDDDKWLARPSGLCGYCPCTKKQCEFAKK